MNFINVVKMVLGIVPEIVSLVVMLEKLFPAAGIGTEKLTMLKRILAAAYDGITEFMPSIEKIVTVMVELFNKFGWPEKDEKGDAPAQAATK